MNFVSYIKAIDTKNVEEIKSLIINNSNNTNNNEDILYKLYDKNLLTFERLNFLTDNYGVSNINLSSTLIKRLIKDDNVELLSIIIESYYFFDNEFIIKLLNLYKNKIPISKTDLKQQFSKYKFSNTNKDKNDLNDYLIETCRQNNEFIAKYLIEHGIDINKQNKKGESPIFTAYLSGNKNIVKCLIKYGAEYVNSSTSIIVNLWGLKKEVGIEVENLVATDLLLDSILPIIESRISFLNEQRSKIEKALIEDDGIELAECWVTSAESSKDEENCYIMENGQKVYCPITEEYFRSILYIDEAEITFEDSLDNVSTEFFITCNPDIFAGHALHMEIDQNNKVLCYGLCG